MIKTMILALAIGDNIYFDNYFYGRCTGTIGNIHFKGTEFFVKNVKCGKEEPGVIWLLRGEIGGKI